ncbi:hypothetical protein [Micropruina glycogenica]|uniref:Fenitrothion hydrolase n=1 Tax=Micropruina glycogenica TaxID=75385 RepID=A0A2N9JDU8_9ACTN|nr:hypothetical protein [Micropruina glycogenica]SPD86287.1 conserved membrane protein of unknown function [Micropruina glycogenica]
MILPLHGLGSRQDLPLPFELVLLGAALALLLSFGALVLAWRRPRFTAQAGLALPGLTRMVDAPVTRALARLLALALYGWMALALWFGQDRVTNPVFGFVFVWLWVGLVPVSLLFGSIWRLTNPLRTLARLVLAPRGPLRPLSEAAWQRVGITPGVVTLLGFAWLELVQPGNNTLPVLRWWAVAWFVGAVGGSLIFGERWVSAFDPFEVFAERIATLSPWQRVDGVLHLVNPLRHACTAPVPRGTAAVTATLLGITAYDSFTNTTVWVGWVQTSTLPRTLWGTLGLVGMTVLVGGAFALAARATAAGWTNRLAASLVPIVVGYNFAHYLSLLVLEGQRTAILASDPLGLGWNVFGTAELGVNTGIFDYPQPVAIIQLCAIVLGHLLGVLIAHDRSLVALNGRRVIVGQLPMLMLMVGYTVAGLVLLFSP